MVEGLVRSKSQLEVNPNPPCQHSLWEETYMSGALGLGNILRMFSLRIEPTTARTLTTERRAL
jgi:hypothetical protein